MRSSPWCLNGPAQKRCHAATRRHAERAAPRVPQRVRFSRFRGAPPSKEANGGGPIYASRTAPTAIPSPHPQQILPLRYESSTGRPTTSTIQNKGGVRAARMHSPHPKTGGAPILPIDHSRRHRPQARSQSANPLTDPSARTARPPLADGEAAQYHQPCDSSAPTP